jgi:dTDP-4-dehydrorhamnose reductase
VKILVTGCNGQLGRSLTATLDNHRVEAAGHDKLDITSLSDVRGAVTALAPDIVINTAAYNDVDGCERDRMHAYRINALGPRNLALATAATAIPLLHVSTDYVFDGAASQPYHEFDQPRPLSVYGASKLAGEAAVRELNPRHYIVRTAWLFHPAGRNFLNLMRALSAGPQVKVVADQYGSATYAPHLAEAIARLIETEAFGLYHMAGQGVLSRYDMTRLLFDLLGLKTAILPVPHSEFPAAAARPHYSALTTIQEPRITLPPWQDGVAAFARVILENSSEPQN